MNSAVHSRAELVAVVVLAATSVGLAAMSKDELPYAKREAGIHYLNVAKLLRGKDYASAERELDLAIRLDPTQLRFYSARGQVFLAQGKVRAAISEFDLVLKADRFDRQVQLARGVAKTRLMPPDVSGACADFLAVKVQGAFPDTEFVRSKGAARYCAGQPGWSAT